MPRQPRGEVGHGRAGVHVVPLLEQHRPELSHLQAAPPRQVQQQEVGAAVVDLLVEELPRDFELPNPRSEAEAGPPGNRRGQDVDGVADFEQGAAEGEVGVVVGHEPVGARGVHDEQDHRPDAAPRQLGELEQVPPAAGRDGIGEHGDAVAVEGAGLHLEIELAAPA